MVKDMISYNFEKIAETREVCTLKKCVNGEIFDANSKGERIMIEFSYCFPDNTNKNSLPNLWKKYGYIDRVLESYISIDVIATDKDGNSWGKYNPQVKSNKINFDFMLEVNKENKIKLMETVAKLAFDF